MSNRNNLQNNFKDLIVITGPNGSQQKLWGLVQKARDLRQIYQSEVDYVEKLREQLNSSDSALAAEAKKALIYLNAFTLAVLDGNFVPLAEQGIFLTKAQQKSIYLSRNAAQRDFVSNNLGYQQELNDLIDPSTASTIGELADSMKCMKQELRKSGTPVSTLYKTPLRTNKKVSEPLPIKKYSSEQIAELNKQRNGK